MYNILIALKIHTENLKNISSCPLDKNWSKKIYIVLKIMGLQQTQQSNN